MRVSFWSFNVLCRKRKTWSHRKKFVKPCDYKTMKLFREKVDFTEFMLILSETKLSLLPQLCTAAVSHCGNYGNSLSRFFEINFVKATILKLQKSWFHEIFFRWERISRFSTLWHCTVWKLRKFTLTFGNNFVKVMVLLKKLLNSWFDEIFLWWE